MKNLIHQHGIPHKAASNQEIHFIVETARNGIHKLYQKPQDPEAVCLIVH